MKKVILAVVIVVGSLSAAWLLWPWGRVSPPDAKLAPPEDVRGYLASNHFLRLSREQQGDYLEKLWNQPPTRLALLMQMDDLPKKQRDRIRRNVARGMMQMMVKQAQEFSQLPPEKQDGYLDEKIGEMMAKMEKVSEESRKLGTKLPRMGPLGMSGSPSPDLMQKHMERMLSYTTPRERALLRHYHAHVQRRVLQRIFGSP